MSDALFTGEYPIANIAGPMERIGVAARAAAVNEQRRAGLEAKKKQAQSEALQKLRKNQMAGMGAMSGIDRKVHPYAQDIADQYWDQLTVEAMPYMNVEDGYKVIEGMVRGYVSSIEDLRTSPDMQEAESNLELYLDPYNSETVAYDKSLGAMHKSDVSLDYIDQRRNYQYTGLFQEGTTEPYYDNGRFGVRGIPLGVDGKALANQPIDLLDHPMFNSPQSFTAPTKIVTDMDSADLAKAIVGERTRTNMDYDPNFLNSIADLDTGYGDWYQGSMDLQAVDENTSHRLKFRINAFLKAKVDRLDYDEEGNLVTDQNGAPVIVQGLNSVFPEMNDDELFKYFTLDPNLRIDSMPGGNRSAWNAAQDALQDYWFSDVLPKVEYKYKERTGTTRTPEELFLSAAVAAPLNTQNAALHWRNPDVLNFTKDEKKDGTFKTVGIYNGVGIEVLGADAMQNLNANFLNPRYASQAAFFIEKGWVNFNNETGRFTEGPNAGASGDFKSLIEQMVSGDPYEFLKIVDMGVMQGRTDVLMVTPAGYPAPVAIPVDETEQNAPESTAMRQIRMALANANPPMSVEQFIASMTRGGGTRTRSFD